MISISNSSTNKKIYIYSNDEIAIAKYREVINNSVIIILES